jgi:hypothetical protein
MGDSRHPSRSCSIGPCSTRYSSRAGGSYQASKGWLDYALRMSKNAANTGGIVSYRNKTYVAFASEDIGQYRMMEAWRDNQRIDFNFYDAHDLNVSRDTSQPETIKRNLRERMKSAKEVVLLGSAHGKRKGSDGKSFLAHEIEVLLEFGLPVVVVNLDQDRTVDKKLIPDPLLQADYYTVSVSYQPKIIKFALENYAVNFDVSRRTKSGPHQYGADVYSKLGL